MFQTELHWSNWETHILCLLWNFILREILRDLRCLRLATLHCEQFTQVRSLPGLSQQFQLSGLFPSSPESSNCLRVQLHLFHLVLCDRIPPATSVPRWVLTGGAPQMAALEFLLIYWGVWVQNPSRVSLLQPRAGSDKREMELLLCLRGEIQKMGGISK